MAATARRTAAEAASRSSPCRIELPPPTPLSTPSVLLDQELAVHHRDAPVAAAADELALLKPVAEVADVLAQRDPLFAGRQPVVHGRGGTGHQALAGAVGHRLGQRLRSKSRTPGRPRRAGRRAFRPAPSRRSTPASLSQAMIEVA